MTVYFYTPQLESYNQIKEEEDLINHTSNGLGCWIHLAGFHLKNLSKTIEPVITDKIPEEGIIVFHKGFFPRHIKPTSKQYFVCVQADYGRHRYAQMHIVQNAAQIANASVSKQSVADKFFSFAGSVFMPLWLQPGLIGRSVSRGDQIENVHFFGNPEQFPAEDIKALTEALATKDLQFELKLKPEEWTDYSKTDITLALRSFGQKPYYNKPISKLVNAVLCGSLVIAGNESSSWYFKKRYFPELPVVSSREELMLAVDKLLQDPYASFEQVKSCREKLAEVSTPALVRGWEAIMNDASKNFSKWQRSNPVGRKVFLLGRSV